MYLTDVEARLPKARKAEAKKVLAYMWQINGTFDDFTDSRFNKAVDEALKWMDDEAAWLNGLSESDQKKFWSQLGVEV